MQEVAVGLVQPASATLYDYYNPGKYLGHQDWGCGGAGRSWGSRLAGRRAGALTLSLLSSEHKCSVFYGAPAKSKLLSTLCSGDVCQCAEGEAPGGGGGGRAVGGRGRGRDLSCPCLTWALPSGKCPRQRRALERGLMEEEGYRMKFACYYPRVDYGQSPALGAWGGPQAAPSSPSSRP